MQSEVCQLNSFREIRMVLVGDHKTSELKSFLEAHKRLLQGMPPRAKVGTNRDTLRRSWITLNKHLTRHPLVGNCDIIRVFNKGKPGVP